MNIKGAITEKIGPLPAWGWVVVGVGAYLGYRLLFANKSSTAATYTPAVGPPSAPGAVQGTNAPVTAPTLDLGPLTTLLQNFLAALPGSPVQPAATPAPAPLTLSTVLNSNPLGHGPLSQINTQPNWTQVATFPGNTPAGPTINVPKWAGPGPISVSPTGIPTSPVQGQGWFGSSPPGSPAYNAELARIQAIVNRSH